MDACGDCAVCLCSKVTPVKWPSACGHTFCERCCFAVLERGSYQCPLCRDSLAPSDASQILLGNNKLERDAKFIPPTDDPEYAEREAADAEAVAAAIARRRKEDAEGSEVMLFCMGSLCLRRGQHLGICLFEPRYRLMVSRALEGDGTFGIVTTSVGFRAGARGRMVKIIFQRQRPDGAHDVIVQVGASFTVSDNLWALSMTGASAHAPPLMCTRTRIEEADDEEGEGMNGESAGGESVSRSNGASSPWRVRVRWNRRSSHSSSYEREEEDQGNTSPGGGPTGFFARRAGRGGSSSSSSAASSEDGEEGNTSSASSSASPIATRSQRASRSRAARSAAAMSAMRVMRDLLHRASIVGGVWPTVR